MDTAVLPYLGTEMYSYSFLIANGTSEATTTYHLNGSRIRTPSWEPLVCKQPDLSNTCVAITHTWCCEARAVVATSEGRKSTNLGVTGRSRLFTPLTTQLSLGHRGLAPTLTLARVINYDNYPNLPLTTRHDTTVMANTSRGNLKRLVQFLLLAENEELSIRCQNCGDATRMMEN